MKIDVYKKASRCRTYKLLQHLLGSLVCTFLFLSAAAADDILPGFEGGWPNSALVRGNTMYLGGDFGYVGYPSGSLARFDTTNGVVDRNFPRVAGEVKAVVSDGQGGWYIGGTFTKLGGHSVSNLAHLNSNYELDENWTHMTNGTVYSLLYDGTLLYTFTQQIGSSDPTYYNLFAFNTAGEDQMVSQVSFVGSTDSSDFRASMQKIGSTLYLAGSFTGVYANAPLATRKHAAAIDLTTGSLTAWNPNLNGEVRTMVSDGNTMYLGGDFTSVGLSSLQYLAQVNLTTGEAQGWNPAPDGRVRALNLQGSTMYVAGDFKNIGSVAAERDYLAAVDVTTGNALAWHPSLDSWVSGLSISNGKLYVTGNFMTVNSTPRLSMAKFDLAGGGLESWNASSGNYGTLLLATEGGVLAAGPFQTVNDVLRTGLASIDMITGELTSWAPQVEIGTIRSLAADETTLYVGGDFTSVDSQFRSSLAAFSLADGSLTSWNPGTNGTIYSLILDGSTLYAGGAFTSLGGQSRASIGAVSTITGNANSWNPGTDGIVGVMLLDGSNLYAGGSFHHAGGATRDNAALFSTGSNLAQSWNPAPNGDVKALALSESKLYLAGEFGGLDLTLTGSTAAVTIPPAAYQILGWSTGSHERVRSLFAYGSGLFVGGDFSSIVGVSDSTVVGVDKEFGSAQDLVFNPQVGSAGPEGFVSFNNKVYAYGGITNVGGVPQPGFALIYTNRSNLTPPSAPTGTAQDGNQLSSPQDDNGVWANGSPAVSYLKTWMRCNSSGDSCAEAGTSGSDTYSLTAEDVGSRIRINAAATDIFQTVEAISAATDVIAPRSSAAPSISGNAAQGEEIQTNVGSWNGAVGLTYSYQWYRCDSSGSSCTPITEATSNTYLITPADAEHTLRVKVGAQANGSAVIESDYSAPTQIIISPTVITTPTATPIPTLSPTPTLSPYVCRMTAASKTSYKYTLKSRKTNKPVAKTKVSFGYQATATAKAARLKSGLTDKKGLAAVSIPVKKAKKGAVVSGSANGCLANVTVR